MPRALMLPDALLACATRLAAVLPGLSPLGLTLAVCRLRDLRTDFALRFTAMLTLGFSLCESSTPCACSHCGDVFRVAVAADARRARRLDRGRIFCPAVSQISAAPEKLRVFSYYCWDAAVIALILALINA